MNTKPTFDIDAELDKPLSQLEEEVGMKAEEAFADIVSPLSEDPSDGALDLVSTVRTQVSEVVPDLLSTQLKYHSSLPDSNGNYINFDQFDSVIIPLLAPGNAFLVLSKSLGKNIWKVEYEGGDILHHYAKMGLLDIVTELIKFPFDLEKKYRNGLDIFEVLEQKALSLEDNSHIFNKLKAIRELLIAKSIHNQLKNASNNSQHVRHGVSFE